MTMTRVLTIPKVANVQPGANMAMNVDVGVASVEKIGLEISGGLLKTNLTDIDIRIDGQTIQEFDTVADLEMMSAYYGRNVSAAEVSLYFRRYEFASPEMSNLYNIGMSDIRTFQIFSKIDGAANPASNVEGFKLETQIPAIRGGSVVQNNKLGLFTRIQRFTFAPNGAGKFEIDSIPRKNGFIQAIHFVSAGGLINSIVGKANHNVFYEASDARMEKHVEDHGRVRQANVHHVDWMLQNTMGNQMAVAALNDLRFELDMAGADTVTAYVEYLSGAQN